MAAISTGNFAQAIWPGINTFYGDEYKQHGEEHKQIFSIEKSSKHHEEDVLYSGFGLMGAKNEGSAVSYDSARQGFTTRYTHTDYGLGFVITRNMYDDDLYGVIGKKKAKALARSARITKETVAANVLNRAFNTAYTYGDALELCSAVHTNVSGGTFQNELTAAADFSEASLEQALIDIGKWTDDRGLNIAASAQRLIIPVDQQWEACRVLDNPNRPGTADRDINATYSKGVVPGGAHVNHFLTDADAWFLITDVSDGLKCFQRRAAEFTMDNDFDTENAKFKVTERYSFGASDVKGIYGSPGV